MKYNLLKDWNEYEKQNKIAERAAQKLQNRLEFTHGRRERSAADSFGLPYTSSSSFAAVWNTNSEARKPHTQLYFDGIALTVDNKPIAIYTDRSKDGEPLYFEEV